MHVTEAIAKRCIENADRPLRPRPPQLDPEKASSQQLAAANELYIDDLEKYGRKADAALLQCATQPNEGTKP